MAWALSTEAGEYLVAEGKVWIIDFEKSERFAILKDGEQ
jgi:predicted Ser/Thr protein kinase